MAKGRDQVHDRHSTPRRLSGLSLGVFAADHGRLHAAAERAAAWGAAAHIST
jgi:hypothetical protein